MDDRHEKARRALVLHDLPLVVDLIQLTLNHGLFAVRAARTIEEAERILADWHPHMAVIDMDHADSAGLLRRLDASGTLMGGSIPALGLTRRGDLKTKLLLDFCVQEVGAVVYNQAIVDAQAYFQARVGDLDGVCHQHEFTYWQRK